AMAARLFRCDLRHCLAGSWRRHDGLRRQRLSPPGAFRVAARHAENVCLLHPLSVRAVRHPLGRGYRTRVFAGGRVGGMGTAMPEKRERDGVVLTEAEKKSRRQRSIAMALALGVLVLLFFAVTLVKGPAVLNRPL